MGQRGSAGEQVREDVSTLLRAWSDGDERALAQLTPVVYDELRHLAHRYMKRERAGHSLQTTALVNEAYMRLVDYKRMHWQDRAHFLAVSAQAMRRILVDHARRRLADKRPDPRQRVDLEAAEAVPMRADELVALDEALASLAQLDPRQAQVVELKFFGGLELDEIARTLGISTATVTREWRLARGWLWQTLKD